MEKLFENCNTATLQQICVKFGSGIISYRSFVDIHQICCGFVTREINARVSRTGLAESSINMQN